MIVNIVLFLFLSVGSNPCILCIITSHTGSVTQTENSLSLENYGNFQRNTQLEVKTF